MATVYLATDTRLDRQVALKVMHPHLAQDESFQSRFYREAKTSASISHPGIVAVFDQGQDAGTTYLVMEYVPGTTLREVVKSQAPVTIRQTLSIIEQILEALGAAHAAGLVHRDVKPENVLITPDNSIKVADFGLARAAQNNRSNNTTGVMMGTIAYIAPEIVNEQGADARTDLYAVGVVLYELLTGEQPFVGDSPVSIAVKHVQENFPLPSSTVAGVPTQLDELVLWATAKDPNERPDDAWEMLTDLKQIRSELSTLELDTEPVVLADVPGQQPGQVHGVESGDQGTVAMPRTYIPKMSQVHEEQPVYVDAGGGGQRKSRSGRIFGSIMAVVVLAFLLGTAGVWWFYVGPGSYDQTPNVVGQSEQSAVQTLESASLSVKIKQESHESIEAGQVIRSIPNPNQQIRKGGEVTLVVSTGSEYVQAPAVTGLTEEQAREALDKLGLKTGQISTEYDESVEKGKVVSQGVNPGQRVSKKDEAVDLVLSKGREPIDVPKFVNKRADQATKKLTDLGLQVKTTDQYSQEVASGLVISQNPASGQLFRGDTVNLVVSAGPQEFQVPNVVGATRDEAVKKLQDLGLVVTESGAMVFGRVWSQSPSPGSMVKRGDQITVYVY